MNSQLHSSIHYCIQPPSSSNTKLVNTNELMTVCFEASTKEEMWNCQNLATTIADWSPSAWKQYYSGEAAKCLSKKSLRALEILMKRVEKADERIRAKRKLEFNGEQNKISGVVCGASSSKQNRVHMVRSRVKGGKIYDFEDEGDKLVVPKSPLTKKWVLVSGGRHRSARVRGQRHVYFEEDKNEKGVEKVIGGKRVDVGEPTGDLGRVIVCALAAVDVEGSM